MMTGASPKGAPERPPKAGTDAPSCVDGIGRTTAISISPVPYGGYSCCCERIEDDRLKQVQGGPVVLQRYCRLLVVLNGGTGGTTMIALAPVSTTLRMLSHRSHLSVPPALTGSCGVPPVPLVPPQKLSRGMRRRALGK
jgi:hypothetical protein